MGIYSGLMGGVGRALSHLGLLAKQGPQTWSNQFCSLNPPAPLQAPPLGLPGYMVGSYATVVPVECMLLTVARHWSSWPQTPHPCPWRRSHHCSSPGIQPG